MVVFWTLYSVGETQSQLLLKTLHDWGHCLVKAETNAIQNAIYISVICKNPNVIVESAYLFKLTIITENVILEIVIGVSLLYIIIV